MTEVSINKQARLSEHLASPSVATLGNSSELDCTRLSPHFTLGELTKSRHTEIYNIPSHVAIENLKRVCSWLEELRRRYNQRYVYGSFSPPELGGVRGGLSRGTVRWIRPPLAPPTQGENIPQIISLSQFLQPAAEALQILNMYVRRDIPIRSLRTCLAELPQRKVWR